ncbi:MAG TPA: TetR/AcrR family transcriptional regulator [Thermomicrobiales bacterium]|nr:TetR/AcrR family transcriptional regulator [Thermomicrobiales bacterium]
MARTQGAVTRQRLLEVANRIVQRDGASQLTLDAVAAEAGVSKGGVLYHFPSKHELIRSMLDLLLCDLDDELNETPREHPDDLTSGAWLRGYIRASVHVDADERDLKAALLAASAANPDLLEPMRERYREWQVCAEQDGIDDAMATILRLAADGLWIADLLDLAPPTDALRARVIDRMFALTR